MTGVMAGARACVWRYCVFYNVSRPGCQEHSSCQNVTNALQLQRCPQNSDQLLLQSQVRRTEGAVLGHSASRDRLQRCTVHPPTECELVFCGYFQLGWIGMEICDEEKEVNGGGGARQMDC